MRRTRSIAARFAGVALCVALLAAAGLSLAAWQSAPTVEEYGPLMTEIRFVVGDADLHVDARYWPELGEDLDKLLPMLRQVEAFWTARGADEAVVFAEAALAAFAELSAAAIEENRAGARAGVNALRGTCQPCHEAYREETADGYRIKPGS